MKNLKLERLWSKLVEIDKVLCVPPGGLTGNIECYPRYVVARCTVMINESLVLNHLCLHKLKTLAKYLVVWAFDDNLRLDVYEW